MIKATTKATRQFLLILLGLALGLAVVAGFAFRDFGGGGQGVAPSADLSRSQRKTAAP